MTGGQETWAQQGALSATYDLVLPDRQGYVLSAPDAPDDQLADAVTISGLLGDGAHLVGYSMGRLLAMLAAARNPQAVKSLILIEPVAFDLMRGRSTRRGVHHRLRGIAVEQRDPEHFLRQFLVFFGNDPAEVSQIPAPLPDGLRKAAVALLTGAAPWEVPTPVPELAAADFPIVVVSGGHRDIFDAICDELAGRVGRNAPSSRAPVTRPSSRVSPSTPCYEPPWKGPPNCRHASMASHHQGWMMTPMRIPSRCAGWALRQGNDERRDDHPNSSRVSIPQTFPTSTPMHAWPRWRSTQRSMSER